MKSFFKKLFSFLFIATGVFALVQVGFAQDVGMQFGEATGLGSEDPRVIAANIVRIFLAFLGIVAVSLLIYAGFIWMTSQGNAERIDKAKKTIIGALIGLAIVLSAFAIASFIVSQLLDATQDSDGQEPSTGEPIEGIGGGGDTSCDGNPLTAQCDADPSLCPEGDYCNEDNCMCESEGGIGDSCDADPETEQCEADDDICAEYLECEPDTCLCGGAPVIESVTPIGGFCEGDTDTSCRRNGDCPDSECDLETPNGAPGNLISIRGKYFGTSTGEVYFSDGTDLNVRASMPDEENPDCTNNWTEEQVIVVVPEEAEDGAIRLVRADDKEDITDNDRGDKLPDFLVNSIERPGLCLLDPEEGRLNDPVSYYGLNLSGGLAYFGNYKTNETAKNSEFASPLSGSAQVSLIEAGETGTFVVEDSKSSNILDFFKNKEPDSGPSIDYFDPVEGPPGQYVSIHGNGFGEDSPGKTVYFGDEVTGTEASFDFPEVCSDSVWTDDQIIVKVPEELSDDEYVLTVELDGEILNTEDIVSSEERSPYFTVDSSLPLAPSLCKIEPTMGPNNTSISLWGEYFGSSKGAVRFYKNKEQSGDVIDYWGTEEDADRVDTSVHPEAASGPVKVVQEDLAGNGMNYRVGNCNEADDPGAACGEQICCPNGTFKEGRCADSQDACLIDIPTSVYEWEFDTNTEGGPGDSCYINASTTPNCTPTHGPCQEDLFCDPDTCSCEPEDDDDDDEDDDGPAPELGASCAAVATTTCNTSICPDPFQCMNEDGSGAYYPNNCGVCCCRPGANDCEALNPDNPYLTCQPDQGECTGEDRGLCCGCDGDQSCGDNATLGCGTDTCCHIRPEASSTMPEDNAANVCANTVISAQFDQTMNIDSFTDNVLVVGEYDGSCPEETEYLADSSNGEEFSAGTSRGSALSFFENISIKVKRIFGGLYAAVTGEEAFADTPSPDKNYCVVSGSVDGTHNAAGNTELTFSPEEVLDTDRKYFVIIKGDEDLDSQNGVLSEWNIGMNGSESGPVDASASFNGKTYPRSYIWSFTTMSDQGNNGICEISKAEVEPASYLFQTTDNDPNENDEDSNDPTFDTARDGDKVFTAKALNADEEEITPVSGYSWVWNWDMIDSGVADIYSAPFSSTADRQLIRANSGVTDDKTKVSAEIDITDDLYSSAGDGTHGEADIRIFLCQNPWPPIRGDGTWYPWRDNVEGMNCIEETGECFSMNYQFYYCRDRASENTVDDLPAIQSEDSKIRGRTSEMLKEAYFFREEAPDVEGIDLATTTNSRVEEGEAVALVWSDYAEENAPAGEEVDHYNIYYDTDSGLPYRDTIEMDPSTPHSSSDPFIIEGLTNGQTYFLAVTAVYSNGQESDFSNEISVVPRDVTGPEAPSIDDTASQDSSIRVEWSDQSGGDAVSFKLYYKASDTCSSSLNFGEEMTLPYSNEDTTTVSGLNNGVGYCIGMTAVDQEGNSSATTTTDVITPQGE